MPCSCSAFNFMNKCIRPSQRRKKERKGDEVNIDDFPQHEHDNIEANVNQASSLKTNGNSDLDDGLEVANSGYPKSFTETSISSRKLRSRETNAEVYSVCGGDQKRDDHWCGESVSENSIDPFEFDIFY
ncbi:hypothetical protein ACOME3_005690 [Neoechinorhynchus agilis]